MRAKRFVEATRAHIARLVRRGARSQVGFTLAELLVVVGIVVGLAAVILPNVGRFTGKGAEAASATEYASVQTAIDAWAVARAGGPETSGRPIRATGAPRRLLGAPGLPSGVRPSIPGPARATDSPPALCRAWSYLG